MSELGNHLKEVREEKQISLDDLQRTTKIQKRYLLAIEEGRFDALPGLFYARAFVKTYAEAVGINADELMETYKSELPNPQKEIVDLPSRSERTKPISTGPGNQQRKKARTSLVVPLVIIAAVIAVVALIWALNVRGDNGDTDAGTAPEEQPENDYNSAGDSDIEGDENGEPEENADVNEEGNSEDEGSEEEEGTEEEEEEEEPAGPEVTLEGTEGDTTTYILTGVDEIEAEFSVSGSESYIGVREEATGGDFDSSTPSNGETYEPALDGLNEAIFNIGYLESVSLVLNGEEVDLPEYDGNRQFIVVQLEEEEE
ncbi:helix-turn-helix domain-containing protein [Shouchella shacheensis]|uniref:helix-turn-helix domain-containing protein n=1 Tax=Shouchella shacheensis TaxID=1649580 RepID=UPI0007400A91|nr:helix-turn-helix domain-containing protein [Shouchella shacheensis]